MIRESCLVCSTNNIIAKWFFLAMAPTVVNGFRLSRACRSGHLPASGIPSFRASGIPSFRVPGFPGSRVPGYLSVRRPLLKMISRSSNSRTTNNKLFL